MNAIKTSFRERATEIRGYLDLLQFVEEAGSQVISRDGTEQFPIDTTTRHVLKASVFLHLYNLIESVVKACLERVTQQIHDGSLTYGGIAEEWQQCWVQGVAKLTEPLNPEHRLERLLLMCDGILAN